jgi:hypothetical protein
MDQMKIEWECVDWIDLTQFWDLFGLLWTHGMKGYKMG